MVRCSLILFLKRYNMFDPFTSSPCASRLSCERGVCFPPFVHFVPRTRPRRARLAQSKSPQCKTHPLSAASRCVLGPLWQRTAPCAPCAPSISRGCCFCAAVDRTLPSQLRRQHAFMLWLLSVFSMLEVYVDQWWERWRIGATRAWNGCRLLHFCSCPLIVNSTRPLRPCCTHDTL